MRSRPQTETKSLPVLFWQAFPSPSVRWGLPSVLFLVLLTGALWLAPPKTSAGADTVVVVSWNVENLFDAHDDPENEGDDEYSAGGWRRWSDEKFERKVKNLAVALGRMKPDIVCLQEVENRFVLDKLQTRLRRYHGCDLPYIVHREGQDFRGIDQAILSRFPPRKTRWITPAEGRRDLVMARFAPGDRELVVFTMHFKSWYGRYAYHHKVRAMEASALRREIEAILESDPACAIIVAGDINDHPDSRAVEEIAGLRLDVERVVASPGKSLLYHLAGELAPEERGTYYYHKDERWDTFDVMAISRGLLPGVDEDASPWQYKPGSFQVFRENFLLTPEGFPKTFRRRKDASGRWVYTFGYSDHLPLRLEIQAR